MNEGNKFLTTKNTVLIGMFAAIMAVISQIQVPTPGGVPVTIQFFGIALIGAVLGWKIGTMSIIVYILLGTIGLPIFAGLQGGAQVLVGFSGGYIWAWPIMTLACGAQFKTDKKVLNMALLIVVSLIAALFDEFVGGVWWAHLSDSMTLGQVMAYSFVAFIPKDMLITVLGLIIGKGIRDRLIKGHLI